MQVLPRLFKLVQDKQSIKNSNTTNKNEITDQAKEAEIIHSNNQRPHRKPRKRESINLDCNEFNKNLAALIRRQHLRALFSNTLYKYSVKIKKEDIIRGYKKSKPVDQSASSSPSTTQNVRNKVLPVSDTSATPSATSPKPKSKMKELIKWYAASKSHKGRKQTGIKVSQFRKGERANVMSESPKISFSLINPERFSTVGSDECHLGDGKGNWITTDDEFVVLEL